MQEIAAKSIGPITVKLVYGDITRYKADAIVNAANKYLEHGGGVALAIAKAATGGDPIKYIEISKKALKEQIGRNYIDHGDVVVTPALKLEEIGVKYVIHTVGPICNGRWNNSLKEKLYKALISPLKKADELGLKSIAFPAVSSGIYGCPIKDVIKTFLEVVRDFSMDVRSIKIVSLVIFDRRYLSQCIEVFKEFFQG
ncbi:MAG: [protein ADP-ribosylglutamate] hydrolase [Euryarchaeota archaeon]|nr:[protein ADP-ribosylglutamate] hydrolase [Euryarchaeota archaeon]